MEREYKEGIVYSGLGTALCVMFENDTKYHFFTAVPELPALADSPDTIDYSTTTNKSITHSKGKETINDVEITMPNNLDNIRLCKKVEDKLLKWAYINLDNYTATLFTATLSYRNADIATDSPNEIAATLVVHSKENGIVEDVYDLFEDTVTFNEDIPEVVVVTDKVETKIKVVTDPAEASLAVSSSSESITGTVSNAEGYVKFTPAKAGSAIITIKATASNYGSNEKYIKVISKVAEE